MLMTGENHGPPHSPAARAHETRVHQARFRKEHARKKDASSEIVIEVDAEPIACRRG
jgi:hypothetical protein